MGLCRGSCVCRSNGAIIAEQDLSKILGAAPDFEARTGVIINLPLLSSRPRKKTTTHSSMFFEPQKQEKGSSLNFPSLAASSFGLAQEKFAHDAFKLLVVVLFLNKTKGTVSIPLCERLFTIYPTPTTFASANLNELTDLIRPLGLHNKRAQMLIDLGRKWLQSPPEKGKRYRQLHYPSLNDGKDVPEGAISDEDSRVAWEIAHLPTVGRYALDSWRIFCRDKLRGKPSIIHDLGSLIGGAEEKGQEWAAVLPEDKELRAYLKWRWFRLGYLWDPLDGRKTKVGLDIVQRMESHEIKSFKGYKSPWDPQSTVAEVALSSLDQGK
ncbi:hypothetical protein MMC10_009941 [Thelotrema lepadinum]|nr:hypothetical protein [Thelotrema lepadinum]